MTSLELWRERLHSENWEIACEAAEQLGDLASQKAYQVLIEALASESGLTRNAAALTIRDLELQMALPALLKAIMEPANVNNRGTLVYALETLECSSLFLFLFKLSLQANYECRCGALGMLEEKDFYVSKDELNQAQRLLKQYMKTPISSEEDAWLFDDLSEILKSLQK